MQLLFKPVEKLTILFLVLLAAIALFFTSTLPVWPSLVARYGALILIVAAIAIVDRACGMDGILPVIRAYSPIAIVVFIFNSLGDLIPGISTHYYDDLLIGIDHALFGVHPTVWLERFNHTALTALFQAAYISYYFMPIALCTALFLKRKHREFDATVFAVILCFYLSYVGYLLMPAVGPRFTLNQFQTAPLPVDDVTLWVRRTLDGLEQNKTDAFPSGHTAIALVILFYAWKTREKKIYRILVPAVTALIISTVYLRYHYVIDVIAGMALALLSIAIAPRTNRLLSGPSEQTER